jgi:hypothetical protein
LPGKDSHKFSGEARESRMAFILYRREIGFKVMKNLETRDIPRVKQPIFTPTVRARKIQTEEYMDLLNGTTGM